MNKLSKQDLQALKTAADVRKAERNGSITPEQADERYAEIERADSTALYTVKLGSTGRFYVSGPACSQSLTAGQVLGILSVKDKIVAIAKTHASAKPRLEQLENAKGEEYGAWFQGDVNIASEKTSNAESILKSLASL